MTAPKQVNTHKRRHLTSEAWEDWKGQIFGIYDRMRKRRAPYSIEWRGVTLRVYPDVYAPAFFKDSFWFADKLPSIVGGTHLLEIGTGTGILAIACAIAGARVVATDINPCAVENASANAAHLGLNIDFRVGDLYQPLDISEKFDYIFWAHPFNNSPEPVYDALLRTGFDYQYRSIRGYIADARLHLRKGGKLLLGTGDSADLSVILHAAQDAEMAWKILHAETLPLEDGSSSEIEYILLQFELR